MRGCDSGTQTRETFRNAGRDHRQNKNVPGLGFTRHGEGKFVGAADDRDDGSFGEKCIKATAF